jgi:hypothetical protein
MMIIVLNSDWRVIERLARFGTRIRRQQKGKMRSRKGHHVGLLYPAVNMQFL